ncbi:MAG: glutamyl-tRNA reductase [Cyanobacteria bacterium P01_H01_bin.74]
MYILVSGVRHRKAAIEIREKFALHPSELSDGLKLLFSYPEIAECAILTTCNRCELYLVVYNIKEAMQAIRRFYLSFKNIDSDAYRAHTFMLLHEEAVCHLYRVAAGIDSMIVGEGQILGQVKDAFSLAQQEKTTNTRLNKLFKGALTVGKRVRTETGIAEKDASVSLAAFYHGKTYFEGFAGKSIVVVGGGKMAEILLSRFKQEQADSDPFTVAIVNRSADRLADLTDRFGFTGYTWQDSAKALQAADLIFVATGAPHVVFGVKNFQDSQKHQVVIDIAVPRNVDNRVAKLDNITLFNTDDLKLENNASALHQKDAVIEQSKAIIEEESISFLQWQRALSAVPVLTQWREKIENIRQNEIDVRRNVDASNIHLVDTISRNVIQKILHGPTKRIKNLQTSQEICHELAVLSHLFNIDPLTLSKQATALIDAVPETPDTKEAFGQQYS